MATGSGDFSIGSNVWPGTSKVIEELGELLQVLGKLIAAHGDVEHWDGTHLGHRLTEETGDVLAAIRFFTEMNSGSIDFAALQERTAEKLALFRKWHAEGLANMPTPG